MITGLQDAVLSFRRLLMERAEREGIEVVFDEEVATDNEDLRPLLIRISKIKNLHGIFNNGYVVQTGIIAKQARELGIKLPIFGIEMYEDSSVLEMANGALEGQFYISASDGTGEFLRRYREKFPQDSAFAAANCYDFVGLLASSPEISAESFRKHLFTLENYHGAVGIVSSTGDQKFSLPAAVKRVYGRDFVTEE